MIPLLATGLPTGTGGLFQAQVVTAVAAQTRFVPTVGVYYCVALDAAIIFQVIDSLGAWRSVTVAGVSPVLVISDQASVAFFNNNAGGGAAQNVTLIQIG